MKKVTKMHFNTLKNYIQMKVYVVPPVIQQN